VAEGVGSELHVIPMSGVSVLGGARGFGDTKERMKGGFLPGSHEHRASVSQTRLTLIGVLHERFGGLVDGIQVGKV